MSKLLVVLAALAVSATPVAPEGKPPPPPVCTPPPIKFDAFLKLDAESCHDQPDGTRTCFYPAPQAGVGGLAWVFRGCFVIMQRTSCDASWEPLAFVCSAPVKKDAQEAM